MDFRRLVKYYGDKVVRAAIPLLRYMGNNQQRGPKGVKV